MSAEWKGSVTVHTQSELDALPDTFNDRICIAGGTPRHPIVVRRRFVKRPVARGESFVVVRQRAWLQAVQNSTVHASGNSQVAARGHAKVFARGCARVEAHEESFVQAAGRAKLRLSGSARALILERAGAVARGTTQVYLLTQGIVRLEQGARAWLYNGRRPVVTGFGTRLYDRRRFPPLFQKDTEVEIIGKYDHRN